MYICFDGKMIPQGEPVLLPANKAYRYGDGLFETIKMIDGEMPLFDLHMQRLFDGLKTLEFSIPGLFTAEKLRSDIISLSNKNKCAALGRIRLSVSRGEGGIYEQENDRLHYLVEAWPASQASNKLNENGLIIGVYPHARKSTDVFSSLKSASYLPYTMAARYARQQQWNDCLILNNAGNIADATIANVFLVKNDKFITPAADQGGVDGVMRKYLLERMRIAKYNVRETTISVKDLQDADAIFLSNAMNGIRWVGQLEQKSFTNKTSVEIYREFIQPLWT